MDAIKDLVFSKENNRPHSDIFHQQEWTYFEPKVKAKSMYLIFMVYAMLCFAIGITTILLSTIVQEKIIYYPDCQECNNCTCRSNFVLKDSIEPHVSKVYIYYGMTQFYQNHFQYLFSYEPYELYGNTEKSEGKCGDYQYLNKVRVSPCGKIARSLFNDTYEIYDSSNQIVNLSMDDISDEVDREVMYGIPDRNFWNKSVKPDTWSKSPLERSSRPFKTDEALQVWMQTATFPRFVKMYATVSPDYHGGKLNKGNYSIVIKNYYPTSKLNRKFLFLSNTSLLGSKNIFMSIIPLICSGLYLILAFVCIWLRNFPIRVSIMKMNEQNFFASDDAAI